MQHVSISSVEVLEKAFTRLETIEQKYELKLNKNPLIIKIASIFAWVKFITTKKYRKENKLPIYQPKILFISLILTLY